jgi:hypothetical protein
VCNFPMMDVTVTVSLDITPRSPTDTQQSNMQCRFPSLFANCRDTFSTWCDGRRWRVKECSVAPHCNKRVETFCGCQEEGVQTKDYYKLRLTTKAYKLCHNYINCTINLVGRSFGKWRRRCLHSGGSRRVRRVSFGCAVRRALSKINVMYEAHTILKFQTTTMLQLPATDCIYKTFLTTNELKY